MKWTVRWVPSAENKLAALYWYAPDRKVITEAADRIDMLLESDPENQGVPFHNRRMLYVPPLIVTYVVYRSAKLVEVLQVERISQ